MLAVGHSPWGPGGETVRPNCDVFFSISLSNILFADLNFTLALSQILFGYPGVSCVLCDEPHPRIKKSMVPDFFLLILQRTLLFCVLFLQAGWSPGGWTGTSPCPARSAIARGALWQSVGRPPI